MLLEPDLQYSLTLFASIGLSYISISINFVQYDFFFNSTLCRKRYVV